MPFADDFWRLAHHDVHGRPRLHSRAVDVGLAAALLCELLASRHLALHGVELVVIDRTPPADVVSHAVLDSFVAEAQRHTARTWLNFLARDARAQVACRLVRAGHLRVVTSRRLLGPATNTYVPTSMNKAAWPWLSLSMRLRDQAPLDYESACLAALTAATGLDGWVLDGAPPSAADYLRHIAAHLWPPMRDLLAHAEAVIGEAVLAHRT